MKEIWTLGEALCEIMRKKPGLGLENPADFSGPYPSGAPSIFIDTVAKLQTPCGIIAATGDDDFGKCIRKRLENDGVNCSHMTVSSKLSTGVAFVSYQDNGDRTFIFHIGNAASGEIIYPHEMPQNVGIFHVMGCAMMPSAQMCDAMLKAVEHYYEQGALISFDPNIRVESLRGQNLQALLAPVMQRCSIFMPGVEEMLAVTSESSIDTAIDKLFQNPVLKVIVLKDGGRGCHVITRTEKFSVPACHVEVQDSTGAGDSFDAGFLTSYLNGKSLLECACNASATGAINCAAFGPMEGVITPDTVAEMVRQNYHQL